jgi:hypothetical protein
MVASVAGQANLVDSDTDVRLCGVFTVVDDIRLNSKQCQHQQDYYQT